MNSVTSYWAIRRLKLR